jgi:hypothetical protein
VEQAAVRLDLAPEKFQIFFHFFEVWYVPLRYFVLHGMNDKFLQVFGMIASAFHARRVSARPGGFTPETCLHDSNIA